MIKRIFAIGIGAVAVLAAPAAAEDYPPADDVTVSAMSPCPGESVTVTAQAFDANAPVTVTLLPDGTVLGTANADAAGVATLEFTVPSDQALGSYTVQVTGPQSGDDLTVNADIEVVDCEAPAPTPTTTPSSASGELPRTGSSNGTMTMVKIGLGLAAVGGLLLAVARRRQRSTRLSTA